MVVYMSEKREDLKKQAEILKKSREQAGLNRKRVFGVYGNCGTESQLCGQDV